MPEPPYMVRAEDDRPGLAYYQYTHPAACLRKQDMHRAHLQGVDHAEAAIDGAPGEGAGPGLRHDQDAQQQRQPQLHQVAQRRQPPQLLVPALLLRHLQAPQTLSLRGHCP